MKAQVSKLGLLGILWAGLSLSFSHSMTAQAEEETLPSAVHACTKDEAWILPKGMNEWWSERFAKLFLDPKVAIGKVEAPFESFAQGMMLRETSKGLLKEKELRAMGEYWMARSLYQNKQIHLAIDAFTAMAAAQAQPNAVRETLGIRRAALQCLQVIHADYPYFRWRPEVVRALKAYPRTGPGVSQNTVAEYRDVASSMAKDLWGSAEIKNFENDLTPVVAGGGIYENFVLGLVADRKGEEERSLELLSKVIPTVNRPRAIEESMDLVFLVTGRIAYAKGQFARAAESFVKIPRESNYLPKALSDLSWAYLTDNKYHEAMGTSFNLQKSHLRGVFSPESPLVMAMALNELCQYPLAIQSVNYFRKRYNKTYQWLYTWQAQVKAGKGPNLYRTLVDHLQGKAKIPDTIAGEWARSAVFIAAQEEVNLIRDEQGQHSFILGSSQQEERGLRSREQEIKKLAALLDSKGAKRAPADVRKRDVDSLRNKVSILSARKLALQTWTRMQSRLSSEWTHMEGRAIARVQDDFERRNDQMFKNLLYVNENTLLVEIEIFDGASEDMVWKNAHPDYKDILKKVKGEKQASTKQVWRWNTFELDDPDAEIWEDELGWFRGEVANECQNKDKYIQLKSGA